MRLALKQALALTVLLIGLLASASYFASSSSTDACDALVATRELDEESEQSTNVELRQASESVTREEPASATSIGGLEDAASLSNEQGEARGARLRIVVRDCETGEPLPDFRLRISVESMRNETEAMELTLVTDVAGIILTDAVLPRALLDFAHSPRVDDMDRFAWQLEPENDSQLAGVGEVAEFELCASSPSMVVTLDAHHQDGTPVVATELALIEGKVGEEGEFEWFYWRRDKSDEHGRVRIPLHGALAGRPFCAQVVEPTSGEVCDAVLLPEPIDSGPHLLHTYLGGRLDVLVVDKAGEPRASTRVTCWYRDRPRMKLQTQSQADLAGRVSFGPLPAGLYLLAVDAWAPSARAEAAEIELARSELRELTLHPAGDEPLQLVVAGPVYEPDGSPAKGVLIGLLLDGTEHKHVSTDEHGHFEHHARGRFRDVLVTSAATIYVDPIEPAELHVAPGTTGLEFRKLAHTEEQSVVFRLLDGATGKPISDSVDAQIVL
ncbi:MAG: hypothetical protein ACI841_001939 [Planctomycetota bacterium]|jgi:hypothetical protein